MSSPISLVIMLLLVAITSTNGFAMAPRVASAVINQRQAVRTVRTEIKMNFFEDAVRFFSNMKKEASAKHILIKGPGATEKLNVIKAELVGAEDLSAAFSDLASKVHSESGIAELTSCLLVTTASLPPHLLLLTG